MTRFRYVAKDDAGHEHRGIVTAKDRENAYALISAQNMTPMALKKDVSSPWGSATLVGGVIGVWFAFQPCFGILAKFWLYPTIVLGIIGILVSIAKKRKAQVVCGVIGLAFCFVGLKIALKQEEIVHEAFNDLNKKLDKSSKELRNATQRASEDSKSADGVIGALDEGIKALDRLDSGMREIKKGVREFDDVLNVVDKGMKEIDKRVKSADESSKGFDFGSVVHLSGKAVREVDVDKVMDVAGKVAKEVDVDKVMDVAGKIAKEVDVDKVLDVAGKAVKELDMDKVMKVADEGIQAMDQIARSLNDGNGDQGTEAPLTKEQIKEKIQKWQNDRWKKDVIESARNAKGTVSASDLAETCETAELQSVMDLLIADYVLLVNGLDAYAAASDETAALKELTTSVSASDLTRIRDDGAKLKNALNDLKEKASLSDVSRMKALASDGVKFGKLALSVSDVCGVVKNLLAEAAKN